MRINRACHGGLNILWFRDESYKSHAIVIGKVWKRVDCCKMNGVPKMMWVQVGIVVIKS